MQWSALIVSLAAGLASGAAGAAVPLFTAQCPGSVNVDADRHGTVRVNGHKASVRKINADSYEAKHDKVIYSIARDGNEVLVSFTGPRRANGVCTVTASTAGTPAASGRPAHSERAGQGLFDARGPIPCAQHRGQPMGQCQMAVARDPGGSATVVITRPDGHTRAVFFDKGKAIGADLSQADGNMRFKATKEADLYMIRAGDERYEIPEAVVFGG
ncbi:hypothetical protein [uncultured Piscinibacter sp.]|uniref:hypothetical protein n=1 Tax=uncultured Piscinibacter sp. TaxID=1131835 RepID=UPI0026028557|nr:hypothetical protein [uncultured Piscinibacter sp.]